MENQVKELRNELYNLVKDYHHITFWQKDDVVSLTLQPDDEMYFCIWVYFGDMEYKLSSANDINPNGVIQLIESKGFKEVKL